MINFDSMPISWNTVIFKFRWIFATDEGRIVSGQTFHKTPLWKVCPDTILRSSVAKIQRNLKITVFQQMGIESKLLNQM